ncbi:MAG: pentapeptide repeat-containing protein [Pseudomonadota bacterium]
MQNSVSKMLCSTFSWILFGFVLGTGTLYQGEVAQAGCTDSAGAGVDWQGCRKRNLVMQDFDFRNSNFSRADLSSSDLRNTELSSANFSKATMLRASLAGSTAIKANFSGAIASRADFSGADFTDVNFSKADINRSNFSNSVLKNVDLSKGEAARVSFDGAQIANLNLDFSNIARSDFRTAVISGPISMKGSFLFQTQIAGVDLSSVMGLTDWQLEMACGDENTKLPDGMKTPETWPCPEDAD